MDMTKAVFRNGGRRANRAGLVPALLAGLLGVLTLWGAGCADEASRKASLTEEEIERLTYAPKPTRADVLLVAGEPLSCEDVMNDPPDRQGPGGSFKKRLEDLAAVATLEQFMELARPQARQRLNSRITRVVLYQRAKRELGEKIDVTLETVTEKELRRFVLRHGGNNAEADEALRALGMNRSTFKEVKRKQILSEYAITSKLPKDQPITYRELRATYDQMKDQAFVRPAMIQFRLIDLEAAKVELADPNDDPVQAARTLAEKLVTRIMAGEDFGKLAEEYSHGYRKAFGGLWTPRDPESLAEPYRVLPGVAEKIEVGQIAGPIDVPGHAFIMKLEQRRPKGHHPLADVQEKVEEKIRFDRRLAAQRRLETEVAEQTAVGDTDQFLDDCLERVYRSVRPATP